jgi:hypothetical protein
MLRILLSLAKVLPAIAALAKIGKDLVICGVGIFRRKKSNVTKPEEKQDSRNDGQQKREGVEEEPARTYPDDDPHLP